MRNKDFVNGKLYTAADLENAYPVFKTISHGLRSIEKYGIIIYKEGLTDGLLSFYQLIHVPFKPYCVDDVPMSTAYTLISRFADKVSMYPRDAHSMSVPIVDNVLELEFAPLLDLGIVELTMRLRNSYNDDPIHLHWKELGFVPILQFRA